MLGKCSTRTPQQTLLKRSDANRAHQTGGLGSGCQHGRSSSSSSCALIWTQWWGPPLWRHHPRSAPGLHQALAMPSNSIRTHSSSWTLFRLSSRMRCSTGPGNVPAGWWWPDCADVMQP
eukprot:3939271-Rhodomonas_salina.1